LATLASPALVSLLALFSHWLISLIGFAICNLATIAVVAILSVAVATQAAEEMILWPRQTPTLTLSETTRKHKL
jgi:hypothetical protein